MTRYRQPGRGAITRGLVALERSDRGGMIRLYHARSESEQRDGLGQYRLGRLISIEEARTKYGYEGVDSSD